MKPELAAASVNPAGSSAARAVASAGSAPLAAARLLALPALLLLAATLSCAERPSAPGTATAATPTPATLITTPPAGTATATDPAPSATPSPPVPLTDAEVSALLRRVVCWYEDRALAASCLPPGKETMETIGAMAASGDARFIAPLIDMRWLGLGWERWVEAALVELTGLRLDGRRLWYEWLSGHETPLPPGYVTWKGRLLSLIDARFALMLDGASEYSMRPELLTWGDVAPNEVAPLEDPRFVHRLGERYLEPEDIVYGLVLGGQARAYPRRIVAWHRVVHDANEGEAMTLVYCAPCDAAVAYDPRTAAGTVTLGDAGLAYGTPLLFDEESYSLWDPLSGRPVAGALLGAGVELERYTLVTTTWEDWSLRHPNTQVLDLDTGRVRDYSPGAALASPAGVAPPDVFAGEADRRLSSLRRVLGVVLGGEARAYPVALLQEAGITHDRVGGDGILLLSQGPGKAVAVYRAEGLTAAELRGPEDGMVLVDTDGEGWFVTERALISTLDGRRLFSVPRVETHWLQWSRAYPDTSVGEP